jgi:hypothetical protein
MPARRKGWYLGMVPKGVISPCGLMTMTVSPTGCAEGFGEVAAEDDGRARLILAVGDGTGVRLRGRRTEPGVDGVEEVADGGFFGGEDAFDEGAAIACAAGDEDLLIEAGGGGGDVGDLAEFFEQEAASF